LIHVKMRRTRSLNIPDPTAIETRGDLGQFEGDDRRSAMLEELDRHRHEVALLSRALSEMGRPPGGVAARAGNAHTVLLAADMTKHQISIALLAAQLLRRPT
jgi:hypothetical protein